MRKFSTLAASLVLAGYSAAQPPAEAPMPMPKPEPKAKVVPDRPHKIFVGEWHIQQYLRPFTIENPDHPKDRPFPQGQPISKGTIEFRDDLTFTWRVTYNERDAGKFDTIHGKYQVYDQKLVLTRTTSLGLQFEYNFTRLDIVNGKVIRPIGANCYEEWTLIPPKKKN